VPIYEFYCPDCHTIFNFLARSANTTKRPRCPRCGRPKLQRQVSRFAVSKGRPEKGESDSEPDFPPGFDESRFERALEELAREADTLDEENPRDMARMMRKLFASTGMELSGRMEEAIRRLEAGEDPDALEEEYGDLFDEEGELPFGFSEGSKPSLRNIAKKLKPPNVDETLYEL
jgi:putative FmdB family regulatory protein